ncbi:hypothetical protein EJB05_14085, partial [Eragrostis curvula]
MVPPARPHLNLVEPDQVNRPRPGREQTQHGPKSRNSPPPPTLLYSGDHQHDGVGAGACGDLVEDILLRFPPDDPASLVRAALVCKESCRIVSGPGFRRRFCELHRMAPILGVLCNSVYEDGYSISRFFPSSSSSSWPPQANFGDGQALDARHGRVLFRQRLIRKACLPDKRVPDKRKQTGPEDVWDAVTGERRALPILPLLDPCSWRWNAAVLCAVHGACDHLGCHGGPFLVVLLEGDSTQMRVQVYSSEPDVWSEPTYGPQPPSCGIQMVEKPNGSLGPRIAPTRATRAATQP